MKKSKNLTQKILSVMIGAQWMLSPLAFAEVQKTKLSFEMKSALTHLGYTGKRKFSFQEIWSTSRNIFPEKQRNKMDQWMAYNGYKSMPTIDVSEVTESQGDKHYRWFIKGEEGNVTVDFLGEDEKFIKVNNTYFSKSEVYEIDPLVSKLSGEKFTEKAVQIQTELSKTTIPQITYQDWIKLTPEQRAEYFIQIRQTLIESMNVLDSKGKKTAQNSLNHLEMLWSLMSSNAFAQENDPCIVAGYVGQYKNGPHVDGATGKIVKSGLHCSVAHGAVKEQNGSWRYDEQQVANYNDNKARGKNVFQPTWSKIGSYNAKCQDNTKSVACNPYLFGMSRMATNSGNPICVGMESAQFSVATSQCDKMSPLKDAKDTHLMVKTMLDNHQGVPDDLKKFINCENLKDCQKLNQASYDFLKEKIINPFNSYIENALQLCQGGGRGPDKNQGSACDVLAQRKLAFGQWAGAIGVGGGSPSPVPPPAGEKPPVPGSDSKPPATGKPDSKPPVVIGDMPAGSDRDDEAGARKPRVSSSSGFCSGGWKYACVGGVIGAVALGSLWIMKSNQIKSTTPTYTPPYVGFCPPNWVQTGTTAATCYPPGYTANQVTPTTSPTAPGVTYLTPVTPPTAISSSTTTLSPSAGTK